MDLTKMKLSVTSIYIWNTAQSHKEWEIGLLLQVIFEIRKLFLTVME